MSPIEPIKDTSTTPDRGGRGARGRSAATAPAARASRALEITSLLQTTLDPQRLVEIYAREAGASVPLDGLRYRHAEQGLLLQVGQMAVHTCSYRLTVEDEYLGEITYTRRKRFNAGEIALLEELLCCLVYPLRNGLAHQSLLDCARLDPLTGVQNRTSMETELDRNIQLAQRHATPLSLIIMDIDHFKLVNDTHGHAYGDLVLKEFVRRVQRCLRTSDELFRFGGEEFVLLLPNTPAAGAHQLAERIRRTVARDAIASDSKSVPVTVSLGVASLIRDENRDSLFDRADSALYRAKESGRNRTAAAG